MNIKSSKILLLGLLFLFIVWRMIFSIFISDLENATYINYFVIIIMVSISLLSIFFMYHYTDIIHKSIWITGKLVLKKRGAFNTFNRAGHYDYVYKTYFKIIDDSGKAYLLIGRFLPEDIMILDESYTIKIRNRRILEIK